MNTEKIEELVMQFLINDLEIKINKKIDNIEDLDLYYLTFDLLADFSLTQIKLMTKKDKVNEQTVLNYCKNIESIFKESDLIVLRNA